MPVVSEMRHPRSLSFASERLVVMLRDVRKMKWDDICKKVKNLEGKQPCLSVVQQAYRTFNRRAGRREYKYKNCGRKTKKATPEVTQFLVRRLKELRKKCVCTSTTLKRELITAKGVDLEASYIRRILTRAGYRWLPKAQKRKYSKELAAERLRFAKAVVRLTKAELDEKLSFSMDGVVLALPPSDPTDRANFCAHGDTHMWRQPSESCSVELAGKDDYPKRVGKDRILPMWGGLSKGGFAIVGFHPNRKLCTAEWVKMVKGGKLTKAIRALGPVQPAGPWKVLCDGETFLRTADSTAAHEEVGVDLWTVPASSPDLNPIEQMWAWLRKELRRLDREDLVAKKPPILRIGFQARVRKVLATQKAQRVASKIAGGFKKKCKEIVAKQGKTMARG